MKVFMSSLGVFVLSYLFMMVALVIYLIKYNKPFSTNEELAIVVRKVLKSRVVSIGTYVYALLLFSMTALLFHI